MDDRELDQRLEMLQEGINRLFVEQQRINDTIMEMFNKQANEIGLETKDSLDMAKDLTKNFNVKTKEE